MLQVMTLDKQSRRKAQISFCHCPSIYILYICIYFEWHDAVADDVGTVMSTPGSEAASNAQSSIAWLGTYQQTASPPAHLPSIPEHPRQEQGHTSSGATAWLSVASTPPAPAAMEEPEPVMQEPSATTPPPLMTKAGPQATMAHSSPPKPRPLSKQRALPSAATLSSGLRQHTPMVVPPPSPHLATSNVPSPPMPSGLGSSAGKQPPARRHGQSLPTVSPAPVSAMPVGNREAFEQYMQVDASTLHNFEDTVLMKMAEELGYPQKGGKSTREDLMQIIPTLQRFRRLQLEDRTQLISYARIHGVQLNQDSRGKPRNSQQDIFEKLVQKIYGAPSNRADPTPIPKPVLRKKPSAASQPSAPLPFATSAACLSTHSIPSQSQPKSPPTVPPPATYHASATPAPSPPSTTPAMKAQPSMYSPPQRPRQGRVLLDFKALPIPAAHFDCRFIIKIN